MHRGYSWPSAVSPGRATKCVCESTQWTNRKARKQNRAIRHLLHLTGARTWHPTVRRWSRRGPRRLGAELTATGLLPAWSRLPHFPKSLPSESSRPWPSRIQLFDKIRIVLCGWRESNTPTTEKRPRVLIDVLVWWGGWCICMSWKRGCPGVIQKGGMGQATQRQPSVIPATAAPGQIGESYRLW